MAESTLSIGYPDLTAEVGQFLGHGRDSTAWTADQTSAIDDYVQAGVRQFYYPPAVEGVEVGFDWSFLQPTTTLDTTADDADQDMPDDFGRVLGNLSFEPDECVSPVVQIGVGRILAFRQQTDSTSVPRYFAINNKTTAGTDGQRFEIMFHPTPDDAYTLAYRYEAFVSKLSAAAPYPLGGMKYAEVLTESCLAVAEQRADGERGIHWESFVRLLAAAIAQDRKGGARYFGPMGEQSEQSPVPRRSWGLNYPVTYDGVTW